MNNIIYFKDSKILIRDICEEDIIVLFSWWIDKEVYEYDPRPFPCTCEGLVNECKNFCEKFKNEALTCAKYKYFIITNDKNKLIGFINVFNMDFVKRQCELGIIIGDKRYWNLGIGYKSLNVIIPYIFKNMDIKRIYIETLENNFKALKLFNKLNFKRCSEYAEDKYKFIIMEINN